MTARILLASGAALWLGERLTARAAAGLALGMAGVVAIVMTHPITNEAISLLILTRRQISQGVGMATRNVLIVDDEPNMRRVLSKALEQAGYTVTAAEGGDEAVAALARVPADLVLLDLKLKGEPAWP